MIKGTFPIEKFRDLETPFYYYDMKVLRDTLAIINKEAGKYDNFHVHYAVKANANPKILNTIRESGLGADCVSGGEVHAAVQAGFPSDKIVYAGVGKTDKEINYSLDHDIFCFNVESVPELEVINELASAKGKIAQVAFRINPNVGAHTHANITTGLAENKFGISMEDMDTVIEMAQQMKNVKFIGLHFHIGSHIVKRQGFKLIHQIVDDLIGTQTFIPSRDFRTIARLNVLCLLYDYMYIFQTGKMGPWNGFHGISLRFIGIQLNNHIIAAASMSKSGFHSSVNIHNRAIFHHKAFLVHTFGVKRLGKTDNCRCTARTIRKHLGKCNYFLDLNHRFISSLLVKIIIF